MFSKQLKHDDKFYYIFKCHHTITMMTPSVTIMTPSDSMMTPSITIMRPGDMIMTPSITGDAMNDEDANEKK